MNANPRIELYRQARRQAIWAGVWLGVAMIAMVARPQFSGVQQWLIEQALFAAGMLMLFQFGRMFQGLKHIHSVAVPAPAPAWASLEEEAEEMERHPVAHFQVRDIRAFASIDEAREHGWEFGETIAHFGGHPVPRTARFQGATYLYDGLSPERMMASVPSTQRVFGRLLYKLSEPPAADAPPLSLMAS